MTDSDRDAEPGTKMTFENFRAERLYVAGRDMVVTEDVSISGWPAAGEQLSLVRERLRAASLPGESRRAADKILDRAQAEADSASPDKGRFARHVEALVEVLRTSGTLLAAGSEVAVPLHALVTWLGPLGAVAAGMLMAS